MFGSGDSAIFYDVPTPRTEPPIMQPKMYYDDGSGMDDEEYTYYDGDKSVKKISIGGGSEFSTFQLFLFTSFGIVGFLIFCMLICIVSKSYARRNSKKQMNLIDIDNEENERMYTGIFDNCFPTTYAVSC